MRSDTPLLGTGCEVFTNGNFLDEIAAVNIADQR